MGLKDRLRKVELSLAREVDDSCLSRKQCSLHESMNWVLITMSNEHQQVIHSEINNYHQWLKTDPLLRSGPIPMLSRLSEVFLFFSRQAATYDLRPFNLPSEVAEVYLKDPMASPEHECIECGYRVPVMHMNETEVKRYFPKCPLCGADTGEDSWKDGKHTLPGLLAVGDRIYKERWQDYFEKLIESLDDLDNPLTRQQAIEVIEDCFQDVGKYIS